MSNQSGPKIVIIEDDASIREMYGLKLSDEGYDVYTTASGGEGLGLVRDLKPQLVLLDIMVPGVDGITFLKQLRDSNNQVKVMVLSNVSKDTLGKSLDDFNVADYLIKSDNTPGQVATKIKAIL